MREILNINYKKQTTMNTKLSMLELERELNNFMERVPHDASVVGIENYNENKLYIDKTWQNKPIVCPIPNIALGERFLIDMSNAFEVSSDKPKCNAIKTYGLYQCVCDSITLNNYNPKVVMDIRIASIDKKYTIRLEYHVDTFDYYYNLCVYNDKNERIGTYKKFIIKDINKHLFYIDKNGKGEFYNCGCISFDILKAFVVNEYFNVVKHNKLLYLTTCKWNGTKPTAFKSAFTNICCIKLTKEDVEIHLYNEDKWRKLSEVKERCTINELNGVFYYTYEDCVENNTESIVCFEEEEKQEEKPQIVINIEINNIHKTFNICEVDNVMKFIKSQA